MKATVHRISVRNFKALLDWDLNLEGRHLLLYGPNGSGKSSIYWALYTFLQSAKKSTDEVSRYFAPGHLEALLNIHADVAKVPGEIAFVVRNGKCGDETNYRIGKDLHETRQHPAILKADLASDFITYRFFFGFANFRNSQKFDIWPLFERELLPFCVSTKGGGASPEEIWNSIKTDVANPNGSKARAGTYAHDELEKRTTAFAAMLAEMVDSISREAQLFYDKHFASDDVVEVLFALWLSTPPAYERRTRSLTPPVIEFGARIGGRAIARPQVFLNEGKLTQLALSVRLAASSVNLQESDLKLLILDDLLISLDMNNRMKVVEILLSESFASFQKIILTHDWGFFQEFRRAIGVSHPDWCFEYLEGNPVDGVRNATAKSEAQKADEYLHGHCLNEAAVCLRRAAEDTAMRYREWADGKKMPPGKFHSMTENLRAARKKLLDEIPVGLYERVLRDTPAAFREQLVPADDADLDKLQNVEVADRGKLKCQRRKLRKLLEDEHWTAMENIRLIEEVLKTTERVLNVGAHSGQSPIYESEVQKAIVLIAKLEQLRL